MPLAYWPVALPCYCFGRNAAVVDGVSPDGKRFGDNFDQSKAFVFGSATRFVRSKITGDETEQFAASAQFVMFLGYGVNSGCVWSGEYLVAHTKEFRDMNYHTGRRKRDNKVVKIKRVRHVYRSDATTDAPFEFRLKPDHTKAFDTPNGWLDSWWRNDPSAAQIVVPDNNG
jgi:hypothetical protein